MWKRVSYIVTAIVPLKLDFILFMTIGMLHECKSEANTDTCVCSFKIYHICVCYMYYIGGNIGRIMFRYPYRVWNEGFDFIHAVEL